MTGPGARQEWTGAPTGPSPATVCVTPETDVP